MSAVEAGGDTSGMAKVLIVDDEQDVCEVLCRAVESAGHTPAAAMTLDQGLAAAESEVVDAVFLDVSLPDGNGIAWLSRFLEFPSSPEVIIVTGKGDPDGAELALTRGAFDFLQKPASMQEVALTLIRALEYREARLKRQRRQILTRDGILGSSPQLRKSLESLAEAAATENSVLISGETGTGKELFARALHTNSNRASGPFVIVDCSALTENLVESTLFGHVKGAFTGAVSGNKGLIAQAHGGTLFLDEIGELTPEMQKRFLRVLEEKKFRPVGSGSRQESDFRLVVATNRDLESMVEHERFRSDLLFRIRSHRIALPPLRERQEDIQELTHFFLKQRTEYPGDAPKQIYPEVFDIFGAYDWPGNVRELRHTLDQALAAASNEPALHRKHLPLHLRVSLLKRSLSEQQQTGTVLSESLSPLAGENIPDWRTFRELVVHATEERYFQDLYAYTGGKVKEMAKLAGLTQARVYDLIKKHKLNSG